MKARILFLMVAALLSSVPAMAQEDAEGCSDSPLLSRLNACYIEYCDSNEFDEAIMQVSSEQEETGEPEFKTLEGKKTEIQYQCPGSISTLQVIRNTEAALRKSGFTSVYAGNGQNWGRVVTARKAGIWIQIGASDYAGDTTGYNVLILEQAEMEQEMVSDASAWADAIEQSGRVAVHGIHFDTAKATLRAEAEPVLEQLLVLLTENPDLRLRVEGHTDGVGSAQANQTLSESRAAAVVQWLVSRGVARDRLSSAGRGSSQPMDTNDTEAGRAKNRRVELVRV